MSRFSAKLFLLGLLVGFTAVEAFAGQCQQTFVSWGSHSNAMFANSWETNAVETESFDACVSRARTFLHSRYDCTLDMRIHHHHQRALPVEYCIVDSVKVKYTDAGYIWKIKVQ